MEQTITIMKNQTKKKSKYTIATQFTLLAGGLLVGIIVLFFVVNGTFLQKFYVKKKEEALRGAYAKVEQASQKATLTSEEFEEEIEHICEIYAIEIIIVDIDSKTVMYKCANQQELRMALWDKVFFDRKNQPMDSVIEQNEYYQMLFSRDTRSNSEYIEIWGFLSDDNIFLMRTAVESIYEVASITNRFILICGVLIMIVGIIITTILTHKMTKPILELAELSNRMSELDFDVKYEGKSQNEIGLLGKNFNQMSEKLESTISELKSANIQLQGDIKKKEELEEMRSEFISNVSHELKTPIAIIQGYAEGLMEGISDDKESRDYYCSVICDEAKKMNTMVKKLMTLNELEFGNQQVAVERFDIVTLISNQLQSAGVLLSQDEIEVHFEEKNPIYVWGDEFRIEEVFMNYLSNAIHYCKNEKQIKISLVPEGKTLRVSVFNTGDQIPQESIEHLFEKFYKVDKARTRAYGGSGIGLSIVKAIQESMNQGYGVTNKPDGVEFWFEIDMDV